jgi:hypothetical protein
MLPKTTNYVLLFLFTLLGFYATAQVGTPTFFNAVPTTTSNAFPLNTTSNTKIQWVYAPGVFTTTGTTGGTPVAGGNLITKIYIRFATANAATVYPELSISLKQEGTATDWGTNTTFLTGMTQVFLRNNFQLTGNAANSWYGFTLDVPFAYDPALTLYVELKSNLTSSGGNGVNNITTTGVNQRLYGTYSATTGTVNTGLTPIGFDVMPASACTAPPTAGTVTSNKTNVCAGESFTLSLSGNSSGTGQAYQWQRSTTGNAPWTNVGGANASPFFANTQVTSGFYRCAVTCSNVTAYSDSLEITTPSLVGGTYTINNALPASSTNFQSFTDAINHIKCGINSPVVFNVEPGSGPYNEQIVIPQIFGANATNTITFNGNGTTLAYSTTNTNERVGIYLNGADHVIIDSLTINGSGGSAAWGIVLNNKADSNIIRNCTINIGNLSSTSTNYMGIVMNGSTTATATSGDNGNSNLFLNNEIIGGYYNFYLYGNSGSTTQNINNKIVGNRVKDAYLYSIYAIYQSTGLAVSKNEITRPNRTNTSTSSGVYVTTGTVGALIEKNRIYNMFGALSTSTSTFYGIYVGVDATVSSPTRIENNLIYNVGGNGAQYGIYNSGGDYMNVYHNTIALNDNVATSGSAYGIYQTTAAVGINIKNNIVYITRSGTGIKRLLHFNTNTSTIVSNKNVLFINAPSGSDNRVGQWGTTTFTTLNDWKTANTNAYDQQSVSVDPLFVNPSGGDYLFGEVSIDDFGEPVGVTTDIQDSLRSASAPDPGAFEAPPVIGYDIRTDALVSPSISAPGCYNTETMIVRIRNNGTNTIDFSTNPVTVTINLTGPASGTYSAIVNTGSLPSGDTLRVTMATPASTINMSAVGTYSFDIVSTLSGDVNTANDQLIVERERKLLTAGNTSATPSDLCFSNLLNPTLKASNVEGYSTVKWQSSLTTGTGFTDITGANDTTHILAAAPTQSTYYRLLATCGSSTEISSEVFVQVNNPQLVSTTPASRCGAGTVDLSAVANGTATVYWYSAPTGGTPLFTGDIFTTPVITATTTYYAAASEGGSLNTVGAPDLSIGGSPAVVSTYFMNFTVTTACTLQSVDCYFNTVGANFTIVIRRASDQVVVYTYNGTTTQNSTTTPQVVLLNALLTPGNYQIGFLPSFGNCYRNSTGGAYPYTIPGILSITGNSFNDNNYYYYFYNWKVVTGCEGNRVPVVATVTTAPAITATSTKDTICSTGSTTLNVSSTNSNYVYNWLPVSVNGNSITVTPGTTTKYYVNATDAGTGCGAIDSVTIFVQNTPTAITTAVPAFCNTGGTNTLSLNPNTGYANNYLQWQSSPDGITYTNIATGIPYATPVINDSTYYRILVNDEAGITCSQLDVLVPVTKPLITSTTPNYRCGAGSVVLGATASGSATVNWYTTATGGTAVATGNSFTTPSLTNTTTYYVAANEGGSTVNVGKAANGTLLNLAAVPRGIQFNANNPFTILSVKVYSTSTTAGAGIITLYDAANNVVGTPVNVSWPGGGSTAAPVAHVLPLNIAVPAVGTNYKLMMTTFSSGGIGYESSGMSPAAYTALSNTDITFNGSMTSLTALSTSTYYYFYDWQITTGCESPRTAITATIDNDPGCVPVPVSLVQFKGSKQGNVNRLEWVTVNEVNSKGFHVQRSSNGVNFSSIGFVASQQGGNSSSQQSYQFIDEQPLRGNNYYRLQQVDRDGSTSVSNVVLLRGDEVREIQIVGVYPNPTKGELTVQIQSPKAERVSVVLMDISGKQVVQQNQVLVQGSNQLKLNMSGVAQGSYLVKVICANGCQTTATKVVKE